MGIEMFTAQAPLPPWWLTVPLWMAQYALKASATECFPLAQSLLPKVLSYTGNDRNYDEVFHAVVANDQYIFSGGYTRSLDMSTSIKQGKDESFPLIVSSDLQTNTRRWAKTFQVVEEKKMLVVAGLALEATDSRIVVFAFKGNKDPINVVAGRNEGFIWMLNSDGSLANSVFGLTFSDEKEQGWSTSSSAMHFSKNGKVIMAFEMIIGSGKNKAYKTSDGKEYDGRMRLLQLDVATNTIDWEREQSTYFSRSVALAYADESTIEASHIYLGGAADNFKEANSDTPEWAPALFHLNYDGTKNQLFKIQEEASWNSNPAQFSVVNHLKLDTSTSPKKLFGTTKNSENSDNQADANRGERLHVFVVPLNTDYTIDTSFNGAMLYKRLEADLFGVHSFVTGIDKNLQSDTYIHMVIFDPANGGKLYYMKYDTTPSTTTQTVILLYENMQESYFRETVFAGTRTGTVSSLTDARQSYSVGATSQLMHKDGSLKFKLDSANIMGVMLPTLREETCLKTPTDSSSDIISSTSDKSSSILTIGNEPNFVGITSVTDYTRVLKGGDIKGDLIETDDWCTEYSYSASDVNMSAASLLDVTNICGINFDGSEDTYSFILPQIVTPDDCTDASNAGLWQTWLEPMNTYDYDQVAVNIDIQNGEIKVKGKTGGAIADDIQFKANFQLPNGALTYFDFQVKQMTETCTLTADTFISNFIYAVGEAEDSQQISFTTSGSCSALTYTWSVAEAVSVDSSIFTELPQGYSWQTDEVAKAGTYTVTVIAATGCTKTSVTYTVEVIDCESLTVTPPNLTSGASTLTYTIGDSHFSDNWGSFTLSNSKCDSKTTSNFEIDPVPSESTLIVVDADARTVTGGSSDLLMGQTALQTTPMTYSVKVWVVSPLALAYQAEAECLAKNAIVTDPCFAATIDISNGVIPDSQPEASIGITDVQTYDTTQINQSVSSSVTCPGYEFDVVMQDGAAIDSSIFTFDPIAATLTTFTTDILKEDTYNMKLRVKFDEPYDSTTEELFTIKIVCQTNSLSLNIDLLPLSSQDYTLMQDPLYVTIDEFMISPACPITYSYSVSPSTPLVRFDSEIREFIIYDFQVVGFSLTSHTSPFYDEFTVTVTATGSPDTNNPYPVSESFTLYVHNPCVNPALSFITTPIETKLAYSYTLGDPPIVIDIGAMQFTSSLASCGQITSSMTSDLGDITEFNPETGIFKFYSVDSANTGKIANIYVTPSLIDYPTVFGVSLQIRVSIKDVDFEYFMPDNLAPFFDPKLPSEITLDYEGRDLADTKVIKLGQIKDFEKDPFTVSFPDVLIAFRAEMTDDGEILVTMNELKLENGSFGLPIIVTETVDEISTAHSHSVTLVVQNIPDKEERPAFVFAPDKHVQANETEESKLQESKATFEITNVTKLGLVTIQFSEEQVVLSDQNSESYEGSLLIEVNPQNPAMPPQLNFSQQTVSFNGTEMKIQLSFDHPNYVSVEMDGLDTLHISVLKPELFVSKLTAQELSIEIQAEYPLPKQRSEEREALLDEQKENAEILQTSSSIAAGSNIVLNILLSGSLVVLWGLINSLQIVAHYPLLVIAYPENAKIYSDMLLDLASFDIVPADEISAQIMGDEEEKEDGSGKLSNQVKSAGYKTSSFVENNFMTMFVFSQEILIIIILRMLFVCFSRVRKLNIILTKFWQGIFWNTFIRTTLELSFEIAISCMIQMYTPNFDSVGNGIGMGFAVFSLALLSFLALFTPYFLWRKHLLLRTRRFESRFGSLYLGHKTNDEVGPKLFQTFFIARRLLLAALVVFANDYPGSQILVLTMSLTVQLIYIGLARPFEAEWLNRLELHNEYLLQVSCSFILIYSDGLMLMPNPGYPEYDEKLPDIDAKFDLGWCHVGLLGLLVAVNLNVMLTVQFHGIFRKLKLCWLKRKGQHMRNQIDVKKLKINQMQEKQKKFAESHGGPMLVSQTRMRKRMVPRELMQLEEIKEAMEESDEAEEIRESMVESDEASSVPSSPHNRQEQNRDVTAQIINGIIVNGIF